MKKCIVWIVSAALMLCLCACQGSYSPVNLQDPIPIPEDGILPSEILQQIREENAIGCFYGTSGDFSYEWTIFSDDIQECKPANLQVTVTENDQGDIVIALGHQETFGFTGLLSVYLQQDWDAQTATAYQDDQPICAVSLTGTKQTILNLTLDGSYSQLVVRPDPLPQPQETEATPEPETAPDMTLEETFARDDYLSAPQDSGGKVYTDGKDKYQTDPIPAGKPKPVEPEDQEVNKSKTYTCTFSIECSTILNNLDMLDPDKLEMVPSNGVILKKTKVTFYKGESVYDVLQRVCKEKGIHMESSWTPIYNSAYVEGIHNLYEFDCGHLSGWMYRVNGWYPNYGCSRYQLKDGDVVEWRYTCDLGNDVGGKNLF